MPVENIKDKVTIIQKNVAATLAFVRDFHSGVIVAKAEEFAKDPVLDENKLATLIIDLLVTDETNDVQVALRFIEEVL